MQVFVPGFQCGDDAFYRTRNLHCRIALLLSNGKGYRLLPVIAGDASPVFLCLIDIGYIRQHNQLSGGGSNWNIRQFPDLLRLQGCRHRQFQVSCHGFSGGICQIGRADGRGYVAHGQTVLLQLFGQQLYFYIFGRTAHGADLRYG